MSGAAPRVRASSPMLVARLCRARGSAACWPTICATPCSRRSGSMRRGGWRRGCSATSTTLSLRFHLERRTGSLTKIVERGTKSIDMMLYFLLFNIAPTLIELAAICVIFFVKFGAGLVAATLAIVAVYIVFTRKVTDWRAQAAARDERGRQPGDRPRRRQPAQLRNGQIFRRRGARGASATTRRSAPSPSAAVKQRGLRSPGSTSASSLITNVMMAGAMVFTVWGWSQGRFTPGDVVLVNRLLMQLFRPLDMLGWVYRSIRQGLIDMEAMFELLDTPAEVVDAPGAPAAGRDRGPCPVRGRRTSAMSPSAMILKGVDLDVPAGTSLRGGRAVGRGQVDPRPAALPLLRPDRRAASRSTGRTSPRSRRRACARRSASSRRTRCCSTTPSATTSATAATAPAQAEIEGAAQGRGDRPLHRRASRKAMNRWSASAGSSCRAARSSAWRSPAPCSRTRRS